MVVKGEEERRALLRANSDKWKDEVGLNNLEKNLTTFSGYLVGKWQYHYHLTEFPDRNFFFMAMYFF